MSVRMKLTHSKTANRRAHHKKDTPRLVATETGVRRRHFVDPDTGMYRGKQILGAVETKVETTAKKTVKKSAKKADAKASSKEEAGK